MLGNYDLASNPIEKPKSWLPMNPRRIEIWESFICSRETLLAVGPSTDGGGNAVKPPSMHTRNPSGLVSRLRESRFYFMPNRDSEIHFISSDSHRFSSSVCARHRSWSSSPIRLAAVLSRLRCLLAEYFLGRPAL